MKKKWTGAALLTLSGMLAAGCAMVGEAAPKTVTLSSNVKLDSALDENHLAISREASHLIGVEADYTGFKGNRLYFNRQGATYLYDVEEKEEQKIMAAPFLEISGDERRAISHVDEQFCVHDFESGKKTFIGSGEEEWSVYFGDAEGKTVIQIKDIGENFTVEKIVLKTGQRSSWDIDALFDRNGLGANAFQSGEDGVYIAGNSLTQGFGLFHLQDDGDVKKLSELNGIESLHHFQFLDEKTIIFTEEYQGKSGIYTLDLISGEVIQLVAGGKDKEGTWFPFYKLSPDQSKIIFDTPVQVGKEYKTNVYVAEFLDGRLTKPELLMQHADLYAVISLTGFWSDDSSKVYISTTPPGDDKIDTVEVFNIETGN